MLLSFSVRGNLLHICDKTVGSDTIPVLHGLKAISMAWVVLGHTCIVAFKYSGRYHLYSNYSYSDNCPISLELLFDCGQRLNPSSIYHLVSKN